MALDKDLLRRRFRRAVPTYDDQAGIQRITANRLLNLLDYTIKDRSGTVFEIGCSTGLLTEQLLKRHGSRVSALLLNDLVEEFRSIIKKKISGYLIPFDYLTGDIEEIVLSGSFDLIISSSTFHWIDDLPNLLSKLHCHLNSGGHLAFSLYGPDNLYEIREITGIGLSYRSIEGVQRLVSNNFNLLASEDRREKLWFKDPLEVLHHLRKTGVNALTTVPWNREKLAHFIKTYHELYGTNQGVSLTYHPLYMIAAKK